MDTTITALVDGYKIDEALIVVDQFEPQKRADTYLILAMRVLAQGGDYILQRREGWLRNVIQKLIDSGQFECARRVLIAIYERGLFECSGWLKIVSENVAVHVRPEEFEPVFA
jgi:hypothetical protein